MTMTPPAEESVSNVSDELLPCPFADGSDKHGFRRFPVRSNKNDGAGPEDAWWVQCTCGCDGPFGDSEAEAIAAWNRRASLPPMKASRVIEEAAGCFTAAFAEGWIDALANGDIEVIRDLYHRRIAFAYEALLSLPQAGDARREDSKP